MSSSATIDFVSTELLQQFSSVFNVRYVDPLQGSPGVSRPRHAQDAALAAYLDSIESSEHQ